LPKEMVFVSILQTLVSFHSKNHAFTEDDALQK